MVFGGVVVDIRDNMNDIDEPLARYIIIDITLAIAYFLFDELVDIISDTGFDSIIGSFRGIFRVRYGDGTIKVGVGKLPWRRKMATHSSILAWKIPRME